MVEGTVKEKNEGARIFVFNPLKGHRGAEEGDVFCVVPALKLNQVPAGIFTLLSYDIVPTTI